MNSTRVFYSFLVIASLGCTQTVAQQDPISAQPSIKTDSVSRTDSTIQLLTAAQLFHPGSIVYDYRTVSIVHTTLGDTVPRTDTSTITAVLHVMFQQPTGTSLTIQARVDTDSIASRTGIGSTIQFPIQTDTLKINTTTGKVEFPNQNQSSCDINTREAVVRTDEVIPTVLANHRETWNDTLDRRICRAGIQLEAHRVTTYQIDSTASRFQLLRRTRTTFTGRGAQWNQPVEASGQSTSEDTLVLEMTGQRRIQQIRGSTRLELSFRSQLRNQEFQQMTQLFVQLR